MIRDVFKDADRIEGDMGATTGSSWKTPPALIWLLPWHLGVIPVGCYLAVLSRPNKTP
jgi:hypothetical protein